MLKNKTPLEMVSAITGAKTFAIETDQLNRYCIISKEDRLKRAFCFGVPIIREGSRQIVNPCFSYQRGVASFSGTNSNIRVDRTVTMNNRYGQCEILPDGTLYKKAQQSVFFKSQNVQTEVFPTLNGIAMILSCSDKETMSFRVKIKDKLHAVRSNNRCIAFMREKFVPLITVSLVGAFAPNSRDVDPCEILLQTVGNQEYLVSVIPQGNVCKNILLEINMQETKLFQDTTVESKNPNMNNAFGGTAFIGMTKNFGEQWLYSRLMLSNIYQLSSKRIVRSILHVPVLNGSTQNLTLNSVKARFCSFGSTWENKIPLLQTLAESSVSNGYHHFDITHLLGRMEQETENYVIKSKGLWKKPIVISTGDSSLMPQILEVQYQ